MKTILTILLIAFVALITEMVLPWYSIALVGFVVGMLQRQSAGRAFRLSFAGVFVGWFVVMVVRDNRNGHILSDRMAAIFHLPEHWLLVFVIAILGGLIGGLSSLAANLIFGSKKNSR